MYDIFFRAIHYRVGQPIIKVAVVVNHINLFRSNVVQQDLINFFFDLNDYVLVPVQNYEC